MATRTHQNVFFGDTPANILCGIASALQGADTAIIIPPCPGFTTSHPGGMMVNGLGATDLGSYSAQTLGTGLTYRFFHLNTQWYGSFQTIFRIEPHVAEFIFAMMIRQALHRGLTIYLDEVLASVQTAGTAITSLTMTSGNVYVATSYYGDGTYEGDVMAYSGLVTWTLGRESHTNFTAAPPPGTSWIQAVESIAGANVSALYGFDNNIPTNPYNGASLLPGVWPTQTTAPGDADGEIQGSGFRVCLTQNSSRMIRFPSTGVDPLNFELQRRNLTDTSTFTITNCPNGAYDWNYDYINYTQNPAYYQKQWAVSTWAQRANISFEMFTQQCGYANWAQNDNASPSALATQLNLYGLPTFEFQDNHFHTPGWPRMPYPREGRRMVGQYVMTQNDMQGTVNIFKPDSIGLGNYPLDSHTVANFVNADNLSYHFDSNAAVPRSLLRIPRPYELPLRAFLPQTSQCTNLIVLCAPSFSHAGFASYRVEPTFMKAGEAMGTIAGLAAVLGTSITSLNYATQIAPALVAAGNILHYTPS